MAYIFSCLASLAAAMLAFILQSVIKENRALKQKKETEEDEHRKALENGVQCLLRAKLIEYHTKYMEEGSISSHGYENWDMMYKSYTALHGNGMIEHMNDDIEKLHIKRRLS